MNITPVLRCIVLFSIMLAIGCSDSGNNILKSPIPEADPQSPLVGKPAPDIDAKLLDDSDFALKSHASSVVILDFWATWCGPCVMELPILLKVADEYKSKGVELFAVNVGEDPESIKQFQKEHNWQFNVVLDPENKAASAYVVNGIPQLVIIGHNGIVRSVHVGYSDDLERELRSELDTLVSH